MMALELLAFTLNTAVDVVAFLAFLPLSVLI